MNRPNHSDSVSSPTDQNSDTTRLLAEKNRQVIDQEELFSCVRIDSIIEQFNEGFLHDHLRQGCSSHGPLFVLGFSAQARSAVSELLSQHSMIETLQGTSFSEESQYFPNVPSPHELPLRLTQQQLNDAGEYFLTTTRQFRPSRKAYFIDAALENFHYVGLIHLIFPHAKIIEVRETPKEACLKYFRETEEQGSTLSARTLSDYFLQYQELMDHWDELIPDILLHLNLEDLYTSPADQMARILNHCGIPSDQQHISNLITPSVEEKSLSFTEKVFVSSLDKALKGIEDQFRWIKQFNL